MEFAPVVPRLFDNEKYLINVEPQGVLISSKIIVKLAETRRRAYDYVKSHVTRGYNMRFEELQTWMTVMYRVLIVRRQIVDRQCIIINDKRKTFYTHRCGCVSMKTVVGHGPTCTRIIPPTGVSSCALVELLNRPRLNVLAANQRTILERESIIICYITT